ncbi:hypothetical protein ACF0H5_015711 [Mactra antiquata]
MLLTFQNLPILSCIVTYVLETVSATEITYQLPVIPESPYTLDDIMILPRSGDQINVILSTSDNSSVPQTHLLTFEESFQLSNRIISKNVTVEDGLRITTTEQATVTVSLPTGQLIIPPENECSKHFVLDHSVLKNKHRTFLLLQPLQAHTFANICTINLINETFNNDYLNSITEGISDVFCNCTEVETIYPLGLILENVSIFRRLEINTNHAACILHGHETNTSSVSNNRKDLNGSFPTSQAIKWRFYSPVDESNNQFVLLPPKDKRGVNLFILSNTNTSINITRGENFTRHLIMKDTLTILEMTLSKEDMIVLSSDADISVNCSYTSTNDESCRQIAMPTLTSDFIMSNESLSTSSTWIYYSCDSIITVLCQEQVNFELEQNNTSAKIPNAVQFLNSGQLYTALVLYDLVPGLYKLSMNCSKCIYSVIYTHRYIHETNYIDTDNCKTTKSNKDSLSANKTHHEPFDHIDDVISETRDNNVSPDPPITNTVAFDVEKQSTTSDNAKETITSDRQTPNHDTNTDEQIIIKHRPASSDVNGRFKVVVDILNSKEGHINLVPSSKDTDTHKYDYSDDFSGYMGVSENKSFTAIFASLGAALLAVIILILGFLLNEIFSRRQQRRNTRIRPFVSYY